LAGPKADESPAVIANRLIEPNPDGAPYSRIEMEARIRGIASTVQVKRLIAIEKYGLQTKVAYDMKPITVIHWLHYKMIDKGEAQGDKMVISSELGADHVPETFNQFCQRLAIFIENGSALMPPDGEIPMDKLNIPPPPGQPMAPGQQPQPQAFTPPPPPPMPGAYPQGAMPPPHPTMSPALGLPPGVPTQQPQYAPQAPQAPQYAPQAPQYAPQAYAAPAVPPPVVPHPMASVPAPGQQAAPMTAPIVLIKNDPNRTWGATAPRITNGKQATRRLKTEILEDQAWESAGKPANFPTMSLAEAQAAGYHVDMETMLVVGAQNPAQYQAPYQAPQAPQQPPQPMAPQPPPAAPAAPMAMPPPLPMAQMQTSVPIPQTQMQQPSQDSTGSTLRELSKLLGDLQRRMAILDMSLSIVLRMNPDLRAALNQQGVASCEEVLKELNLSVPQ
jgi:hypothetical protein